MNIVQESSFDFDYHAFLLYIQALQDLSRDFLFYLLSVPFRSFHARFFRIQCWTSGLRVHDILLVPRCIITHCLPKTTAAPTYDESRFQDLNAPLMYFRVFSKFHLQLEVAVTFTELRHTCILKSFSPVVCSQLSPLTWNYCPQIFFRCNRLNLIIKI